MSCPDTCTVTPDVTNPCGSGGAGDTGDGGSSSASWYAVSSVVVSLAIAGAVAVIGQDTHVETISCVIFQTHSNGQYK